MIAIIGAGHIGGALGTLWANAGHDVVFGVVKTSTIDQLLSQIKGRATATTVSAAIKGADVILVAIPFGAWPTFGNENTARLTGKVVIDATNPDPERDGALALEALAFEGGSLKFVAAFAPTARLVKAFNTMQSSVLREEAHRDGARLAYAVAGDDPLAIKQVAQLVSDAGFDPVVVGDAMSAKRFDRGTSVWNNAMTAIELIAALKLTQRP